MLLALVAVLVSGCSMGSLMIDERKSPYGFNETLATIQENAKTQGWLVPKVYDFQRSLLLHNQPDPGRIVVLKICHPAYAAKMLAVDDNKYVSVMMPCTVSVYEKQDGNTYVATMNMGLMSKVMGSDIGKTLAVVAEEDKQILAFLQD